MIFAHGNAEFVKLSLAFRSLKNLTTSIAEQNEADLSVCRKYVRQRFLWSRGISYDLDSNEGKKTAEGYIFFGSSMCNQMVYSWN